MRLLLLLMPLLLLACATPNESKEVNMETPKVKKEEVLNTKEVGNKNFQIKGKSKSQTTIAGKRQTENVEKIEKTGEKRPKTNRVEISQIPPKAIETAKLSVLKGSAQIQKEGNIVYEALPKKLKNGCYSVLVKVKNLKEKTEKDYTLEVCNGKVKLQ